MAGRKILGIRTSTSEIRYAVLGEGENGIVCFLNKDGEHKLQYPSTQSSGADDLKWLKRELDRIIRQTTGIEQMVIKTSEFGGSETKSKRKSAYAEAICLLVAAEHNIAVTSKLYSQLGVRSGNVKELADERYGRTGKYWDSKIADAVIAAASEW